MRESDSACLPRSASDFFRLILSFMVKNGKWNGKEKKQIVSDGRNGGGL